LHQPLLLLLTWLAVSPAAAAAQQIHLPPHLWYQLLLLLCRCQQGA
jgi:hypothetical protein